LLGSAPELRAHWVVELAGGASDEGGDDVGGVAVEGLTTAVVAHGRSRIRVTRCLLYVPEGYAGVERGGDERVSQRVGTNPLGAPRTTGDAPHDPSRRVTVKTLAVAVDEDGSLEALAYGEVKCAGYARCEGHGHHLSSLASP
jgi:hypothetical protein